MLLSPPVVNAACTPQAGLQPGADQLCAPLINNGAVVYSGENAQFYYNYGLAVSYDGSVVFVADVYENTIRQLSCNGTLMNFTLCYLFLYLI